MLTGHVPFRGSVAPTVYKDIKQRNIAWPKPDEIDKIMSKEAQDLINRMIQIEPQNRLGHDFQSTQLLKQHPFFNGINWSEISQKNYEGNYKAVLQLFEDLDVKEEDIDSFDIDSGSQFTMQGRATQIDKNKIIMKGNLLKKNRYWKKQLRFFILYQSGELMYYKDMTDFKGSIKIGPTSKVRKTAKTTVSLTCERKNKEYTIMQPENSQVNLIKEKEVGHISFIDDWVKEMQNVIALLKEAGPDQTLELN